MEGGYDASSTVGNQSVDTRESFQNEISNADRIQQQQQQFQPNPQLPIQNQTSVDRAMEIPAAKVLNHTKRFYLVHTDITLTHKHSSLHK